MDIGKSRDTGYLNGKRKEVRKLISSCDSPALMRAYKRELQVIENSLQMVAMYGGRDKPMRTPWRRLLGPQRKYFEQEGQ